MYSPLTAVGLLRARLAKLPAETAPATSAVVVRPHRWARSTVPVPAHATTVVDLRDAESPKVSAQACWEQALATERPR